MKKMFLFVTIIVVLLLASACGNEQSTSGITTTSGDPSGTTDTSATTTGSTGGTVSAMSPADKEFVIKAAQAGLAEVTMGQKGAEAATSADVKAFANRMVQDHSKANNELSQLATIKGLALPTETDGDHKKAAEQLSALRSGKAFDQSYMDHMVKDHENAVADFEKASREAQDADLKTWAGNTLPTLQDHLRRAKEIQKKLK